MVKNLPLIQETQVRSLDQEDPWRREWLPTLVFLLEEFHRHRSLEGYSPWSPKSQTQLSNYHFHLLILLEYQLEYHWYGWNPLTDIGHFSDFKVSPPAKEEVTIMGLNRNQTETKSNLYTNISSSSIYKCPWTGVWINKLRYVEYLAMKRERSVVTYNTMDESQSHYTEWKFIDLQRQHMISLIWCCQNIKLLW